MKKMIIFSLALFAASISFSQNIRIGFNAGIAMANYKVTADNVSIKGDTKTGITLGMVVDVPVSDHVSFQPALNYVQKGLKNTDGTGTSMIKDESTVNLLEIPLNLLFNSRGKSGNFFVGAGPSIAFGISGKNKTTYSDGTPEESSKLKFGNTDQDDLKGLDLGANFLSGYCFKGGFQVSVNYNLGLNNLVPKPVDSEKVKSHYIGIKLGYMLNGGKEKKK